MDNLLSWLILSLALGGTTAGASLITEYQTAEEILRLDPDVLRLQGRLTDNQAERLKNPDEDRAWAILTRCLNFGWSILTPESPYYPRRLMDLSDFPPVLFADGNPELLKNPDSVAVVGSRRAEKEALGAAYLLGEAMSRAGIVTVSGGAVGIDAAAHEGALTGPGGTVAVLGNGFGDNYLPENLFLRRRIRQNGVLLTETEPFTPIRREVFARRNRLIAGMTAATAVMRADRKSGSLITANHAQKFGRALFALSPSVLPSDGCRDLIKDGAVEIKTTGDVIKALRPQSGTGESLFYRKAQLPPLLRPESLTLSQFALVNGVSEGEARYVYAYLSRRSPAEDPGVGRRQLLEPAETRQNTGRPGKNKAAYISGAEPVPPQKPESVQTRTEAPTSAVPEPLPAQSPGEDRLAAVAETLTGDLKTVFLKIGTDTVNVDTLADTVGIPVSRVLSAVTLLELKGLLTSLPGNRVRLNFEPKRR